MSVTTPCTLLLPPYPHTLTCPFVLSIRENHFPLSVKTAKGRHWIALKESGRDLGVMDAVFVFFCIAALSLVSGCKNDSAPSGALASVKNKESVTRYDVKRNNVLYFASLSLVSTKI